MHFSITYSYKYIEIYEILEDWVCSCNVPFAVLFSACSLPFTVPRSSSFPFSRLPFTVCRSPFAVWCLRSSALNVNCAPCRLVEATRSTISARWASIAFEGMKAEGESGSRKQSKALKAHGAALPDAWHFYGHNGNFSVALTSWANSWALAGVCCTFCPIEGVNVLCPLFSTLPPFKQLEILGATQRLWESKSEKAITLSWELLTEYWQCRKLHFIQKSPLKNVYFLITLVYSRILLKICLFILLFSIFHLSCILFRISFVIVFIYHLSCVYLRSLLLVFVSGNIIPNGKFNWYDVDL